MSARWGFRDMGLDCVDKYDINTKQLHFNHWKDKDNQKKTLTFNVCGFPTCVFIESVKERKRMRLIDSFSVHILCIYDNVQSKCTNSTIKYSDQARNDTSVEDESFLAVAVHADGHQHVLQLLLLNLLLMVLLLHPGYPEQTPLPNSWCLLRISRVEELFQPQTGG